MIGNTDRRIGRLWKVEKNVHHVAILMEKRGDNLNGSRTPLTKGNMAVEVGFQVL